MIAWRKQLDDLSGHHSLGGTGITTYFKNGGRLGAARNLANHAPHALDCCTIARLTK
jgi:hypothetical protein